MTFFFVFRLFTNFLQGACITFVIKENKIKHCHSQPSVRDRHWWDSFPLSQTWPQTIP